MQFPKTNPNHSVPDVLTMFQTDSTNEQMDQNEPVEVGHGEAKLSLEAEKHASQSEIESNPAQLPGEYCDPEAAAPGAVQVGELSSVRLQLDADTVNSEFLKTMLLWKANLLGDVQALLRAGAKVDAIGNASSTALLLAVDFGEADIVQALVQAGAKVDAIDNQGRTPLMHAVLSGKVNVIPVLVKAGANVEAIDNYGQTALMQAAMCGHAGVAQELVQAGAKVDVIDNQGRTPLMHAVLSEKANVIPVLVAAGANVDAKNKAGHTVLIQAVQSREVQVMQALIQAGAKVDAIDNVGQTALMRAAESGGVEKMQVLVQAGANLEAVDKVGNTVLVQAVGRGQVEMVKALRAAGAAAIDGKRVQNLIDKAILQVDMRQLQMLSAAGLDFNDTSSKGGSIYNPWMTPIQGAAEIADPVTRLKAMNAVLKFGGTLTHQTLKVVEDHYQEDVARILADGHRNIFSALTLWYTDSSRSPWETRQVRFNALVEVLASYDATELLSAMIEEQFWDLLCLPILWGARLDHAGAPYEPLNDGSKLDQERAWFNYQRPSLLELALVKKVPANTFLMLLEVARLQNPELGRAAEQNANGVRAVHVEKAAKMFRDAGVSKALDAWLKSVAGSTPDADTRPYSELLNKALARAAYAKDRVPMNRLIRMGADPTAKIVDSSNAMQVAELSGNVAMFEKFNKS